ncbi:MAG TPA: hypothetical protein VGR84_19105 [Candidatus Acidoferrales bacterium]|nr:hypothetical protein [Candidatus Acidoferrales bacterium]
MEIALWILVSAAGLLAIIGRVEQWWNERRERERRYEAEWDRSHGL